MDAQQYLGLMAGLQLQYAALCTDSKSGLVGVGEYGVQVTEEFFSATFSEQEIAMCVRDERRFFYEYAVFIHGVRFFCLSERESLDEI